MNRKQLEMLYESNGLTDYKLKTTKDLMRVHGINYTAVAGYEALDDINKLIFERFIVNFFNTWGLESRLNIVPKGIYFVEDVEYLVKENPCDECYTVAGGVIYSIDRTGKKEILQNFENEHYKNYQKITGKPKYYLRFEYHHVNREGNPRIEWLHVVKEGKEWY